MKPRVSEADWKGPGGALKRVRERAFCLLARDIAFRYPNPHMQTCMWQAGKSLFYYAPGSSVALPLVSGAALAMVRESVSFIGGQTRPILLNLNLSTYSNTQCACAHTPGLS